MQLLYGLFGVTCFSEKKTGLLLLCRLFLAGVGNDYGPYRSLRRRGRAGDYLFGKQNIEIIALNIFTNNGWENNRLCF